MEREKNLLKTGPGKQPDNPPLYLFRSGKNRRSYEYLGLHKTTPPGQSVHGGPGVGAPRQRGLPGGEFLQLG